MKRGKIKKIYTNNYSGEIKPDGEDRIVSFNKQALEGDKNQFSEGSIVEFEEKTEFYKTFATKVILVKASERPATTLENPKEPPSLSRHEHKPSKEQKRPQSHSDVSTNTKFPYSFYKRRAYIGGRYRDRYEPVRHLSHERLTQDRYDIAFEIEWQNLTPLAANPCSAPDVPASPPEVKDVDYAGYDKRWLTIDGRLAISPFTVKSAIANGFANLMGSCYRVVEAIEGHPHEIDEGHYYYTGKYKRHRVAMDGSSKPGIITVIQTNEDGSKDITIQPVKEYYFDNDKLPDFIRRTGDVAFIDKKNDRGYKPAIILSLNPTGDNKNKVIYHGKYSDGMDAKGNHKNHKHRFYQPNGSPISGTIRAENFWGSEELKKIVYMGDYKKEKKGKIWYEDLKTLKVGSFVYYEVFGGRVTNIGKNFLFKALFSIDDAIPEGHSACEDPDALCPRCSMFGMTGKGSGEEHGGYRGRFKSATLLGERVITESKGKARIPIKDSEPQDVAIQTLFDQNRKTICRQYLLPIQGQPKPNKRDVDGYFDKSSGQIKGAKYYRHAQCDIDALIRETDQLKRLPGTDLDYTHDLRNFAHVLIDKETFRGVVGAENCSIDEISALIVLLHTPIANHGFKIGIGKALGMGSIESRITRVWIRGSDYEWKSYDDIDAFLETRQEIRTNIDNFDKVLKAMNNLLKKDDGNYKAPDLKLRYPAPVQEIKGKNQYYWQVFKNQ